MMPTNHLRNCLLPVWFCDGSVRIVSRHRAAVYVQGRWPIESIHPVLVLPLAAAVSASSLRLVDDDSDTDIDGFARVIYEAKEGPRPRQLTSQKATITAYTDDPDYPRACVHALARVLRLDYHRTRNGSVR